MKIVQLITVLLSLFLLTVGAEAHQTTLAYVSIDRDGRNLHVDLALAFRDLDVAVGVDDNFDGFVTWRETKTRLDQIEAYALSRFAVASLGKCSLARESAEDITENGDGFLKLSFEGTCPADGGPLDIDYALFFEIDPASRALLRTTISGDETSLVLSADKTHVTLDVGSGGLVTIAGRYFVEGVHHLLSGPDHMLFLLVLILPALFYGTGPWAAVGAVLLPITGFTLAHAMTLTAAASGVLRPPAPLVETFIAVTIMLTAIDNIRPFIPLSRTSIAFAFGLIHGFGFASALGALNLSGPSLAVALLGFNIGIESGQAILAIAVIPVLYLLRKPALRFGILPFGASAVAALIAFNWFIERSAFV